MICHIVIHFINNRDSESDKLALDILSVNQALPLDLLNFRSQLTSYFFMDVNIIIISMKTMPSLNCADPVVVEKL